MLAKLLVAAALLHFAAGVDEAEVDYYERLITEEIRRASTYQLPKDAREYQHTNPEPVEFDSFDFVVVGAGSAGSVVASRLSEINNWSVLLLEAGKEETNFTEIPSMSNYLANLEYNWGFNSTPQNTCCLAMGGNCPFPRGKSLGGTSAINSLVYTRGSRFDYDRWAAEGNPGWSYDDVLPYFIKSEDSHIPDGDEGYHGTGGPLTVEYHRPVSKKVQVFLEANKEMCIPVLDYNGKSQLGASPHQLTTTKGRRLSSAKAFLKRARNRTNLKILTNSYATKIFISNLTNTAEGVLFSHKGIQYYVKANKEVILSAGVVGSPQILMLSGIGPKEHLDQLNIPVVENLAVGQNLHDHLTFYNTYLYSYLPEPSYSLRNSIRQYLNGVGPLTVSTNTQGLLFYRFNVTSLGTPDIEIIIVPSVKASGFDTVQRGIFHEHIDRLYIDSWRNSLVQNHVFHMPLVLLHPKTRGSIYLKSSDPYEYPLIDSRCLDDPDGDDIEMVWRGYQIILKLLSTDAFKELQAVELPYRKCLAHNFLSKEYIMCTVRQTAMNAYHSAGTCKMGPDPARGGVVDHHLRVHGVKNLRVADVSVVPITISAHMNAPAMMIGERAADFIKSDYGSKT